MSSDDLEGAANRIAVFLGFFDFVDHLLSHIDKYAPHDVVVANCFELIPGNHESCGYTGISDRSGMTEDIDTEVTQKHLSQPATRYACSGFACARALKNVTSIRMVVLQ